MISYPKVRSFSILLFFCGLVNFSATKKAIAKVEFSQRLMGINVRMVVDAPISPELRRSVSLAFEEAIRLNMIFSDWEGGSEISRLSRSSQYGNSFPLSNELLEVLSYSQNLAHKSGGAFDVTIGSLSRLWRIARHQKRLPEKQKIQQALKRSGYEKLIINESNSSARLTTEGMVLDLGGIAKGYIADQMLGVMKKNGFSRCLIDAGGDLILGDPPASNKGWRIEIGGISSSLLPTLELSNCAVATSGDLEQYLELDGERYSHLLNPQTGLGIAGRAQVTIIAENGMSADALASVCLVLGKNKVESFLPKTKYFSMYYVDYVETSLKTEIFVLHALKND